MREGVRSVDRVQAGGVPATVFDLMPAYALPQIASELAPTTPGSVGQSGFSRNSKPPALAGRVFTLRATLGKTAFGSGIRGIVIFVYRQNTHEIAVPVSHCANFPADPK